MSFREWISYLLERMLWYLETPRQDRKELKKAQREPWRGHTILLQYVDQLFFVADPQGVAINVHLKKKKVAAKMETYIAARKSDEN